MRLNGETEIDDDTVCFKIRQDLDSEREQRSKFIDCQFFNVNIVSAYVMIQNMFDEFLLIANTTEDQQIFHFFFIFSHDIHVFRVV